MSQLFLGKDRNYIFSKWTKWTKGKLTTNYRIGTPRKAGEPPIICVSAYLGNPIGFKRQDLIDLAQYVNSKSNILCP